MEAKSLLVRLSRHDLVRFCNEKMVCAARDLAEFTKNGINAAYIVALAHKCEAFEANLTEAEGASHQVAGSTEAELLEGVEKICKVGQQIWSNNPSRYTDYIIPPIRIHA